MAVFVKLMSLIFVCTAWAGPKSGEIPWPWGAESAFPWKDVAGVWQAVDSSNRVMSIYSFQVIRTTMGRTYLSIKELDPTLRTVVARGAGAESAKVVSSIMSGPCARYRFGLRSFGQDENGSPILVLTLGPMESFSGWDDSYELIKLRDEPHDEIGSMGCN